MALTTTPPNDLTALSTAKYSWTGLAAASAKSVSKGTKYINFSNFFGTNVETGVATYGALLKNNADPPRPVDPIRFALFSASLETT